MAGERIVAEERWRVRVQPRGVGDRSRDARYHAWEGTRRAEEMRGAEWMQVLPPRDQGHAFDPVLRHERSPSAFCVAAQIRFDSLSNSSAGAFLGGSRGRWY